MALKKILSLKSVSAGYGHNNIVDGVSFDMDAGEVFGLVGLNGVGKTTLIKTILGLRQKTAGEIIIERDQISYLPERFEPPWFLSGYDFIKFSVRLYNKDISLEAAKQKAELVALNPECLTRNVRTYSKGMRQKVGLLATVLSECPLLVLDEPMSGLDPQARQGVKNIIKDVQKKERSVLMCSHILSDVSELCDRVAVFHDKTLIFQGSPRELQKQGGHQDLEKAFLGLLAA